MHFKIWLAAEADIKAFLKHCVYSSGIENRSFGIIILTDSLEKFQRKKGEPGSIEPKHLLLPANNATTTQELLPNTYLSIHNPSLESLALNPSL